MPDMLTVRKGVEASLLFNEEDKGLKRSFHSAFRESCRQNGWRLSRTAQESGAFKVQVFGPSKDDFISFFNDWLTKTYHRTQTEAEKAQKAKVV